MANPKGHWASAGEAGTVLGMKALLLTYKTLGRRGFLVLLYPVMAYFFLVRKPARSASKEYLNKVQVFSDENLSGFGASFRHFMMFGEVLLDKVLAWMGHLGKDDVCLQDPEVFGGRPAGGIIVISHLGNAEICGALANHLSDIKFTALVHTQHADKFNSLVKKVNSNNYIEVMQVTDISPATAMLLSERVNAGEYVIIAGDRIPVTGQQRVSTVNFLGTEAVMPQGAFILAALLKCPVYLMFCLKQKTSYQVYIEHFSDALSFPRKSREQAIAGVVQRYADRLQYYCAKAPLQWFNFYPFWKNTSE